jgi:acetyltransferase
MSIKKLSRIFNPESIAVIGASNNKKSVGYGVMKNLRTFRGKVFPVNIKRKKIHRKKAYQKITEIKEEVDLAMIATPAKTVLSLVKECCEKKVKAIVILASGFSETGKKGEIISREILEIARKNDVRIIGPNCMGFIRPLTKLNASFARNMPSKGNIAFISQSGALGSATLDWAISQNMGFSFFASIGSMIDVGFSDLIDYLGTDPETDSIVIYMESLNNARKFLSAARAFSRNKPIIVLKSGKSEEGAKAALSHTGSLAGNDEAFNAAFKRAGIVRVHEIEELFDCAKTLSKQKRHLGNNLAIITNAGGPGVISTDMLVEKGGEIARLEKTTIKKLDKSLPEAWSRGNPVDILGDAGEQEYRKAIEITLQDKNVDGVLVLLTPQTMTDAEKIAKSITLIQNNKPILVSFMGGKSVEKGAFILEKGNIPCFNSPEDAVKAFMYLYDYSKNLESLYQTPATIPHAFNPRTQENRRLIERFVKEKKFNLTDHESKQILSNYDIPVSNQELAQNPEQAVEIAEKIGYPVAMKIASPDVLHKTEVKGVRLGVNSKNQVLKIYEDILENVRKKIPNAKIDGILVSEMASKRYELIIGCKKDRIFGPTIVFGMGGIAVNVFKDIKIGLPPLNMNLAKMLIQETKIYELLKGYRGIKGADISQIQFILYKFAYLISDFPEIKEVDINPFSVDEKGGIVLDARIILDREYIESGDKRPYSHLVISPYPKEYIKEIKMKNKKKAVLRPIKPEDEPMEAEMFTKFSKKTQRFRFFRELKKVTHEMLVQYTHNDYDREIGIMAEVKEKNQTKMAGVARLIENPYDNSAEFAVVVADPWQGKGLGNQMTDYVLEIARQRNIKKVYAFLLQDNEIMKKMFEKRGFWFIKQGDSYRAEKTL